MYNLMFYIFALMVIIVIIFVTRRLDDSKDRSCLDRGA